MADRVWIGGIYLKDEGGYEVVLRALRYYLKLLKGISEAPATSGSPTLARLLQQEADRVGPAVLRAGQNLKSGLADPETLAAVQNNVQHIQKALDSYRAGVREALGGSVYHKELVGKGHLTEDESLAVEEARRRVEEFA